MESQLLQAEVELGARSRKRMIRESYQSSPSYHQGARVPPLFPPQPWQEPSIFKNIRKLVVNNDEFAHEVWKL
jgi:hypothetical protein